MVFKKAKVLCFLSKHNVKEHHRGKPRDYSHCGEIGLLLHILLAFGDKLVGEVVVLPFMNEKKGDFDIVAAIYPNAQYAKEKLGEHYGQDDIKAAIQKIVDEVNAMVQSYKKIDVLIVRETEFPKNASRKIKRFELPALLADDYKKFSE